MSCAVAARAVALWRRRFAGARHRNSIGLVAAAGTVYLVGAGPGDPGLVTRRALELVREADAIVYDRLIPAGLVAEAAGDAHLHYAGMELGNLAMQQQAINSLLVQLGRAGKSVVRLKG